MTLHPFIIDSYNLNQRRTWNSCKGEPKFYGFVGSTIWTLYMSCRNSTTLTRINLGIGIRLACRYTLLISFRLRKFRQLRRSWGLQSARSCSLTDEELDVKIRDFKQGYPDSGAGRIVKHLLTDHKVKVPRCKSLSVREIMASDLNDRTRIAKILRRIEPEAVLQRKPKIF